MTNQTKEIAKATFLKPDGRLLLVHHKPGKNGMELLNFLLAVEEKTGSNLMVSKNS